MRRLCLAVVLTAVLRAQEPSISGTVLCGDTQRPAAGASVYLLRSGNPAMPGGALAATAEGDGSFTIPRVPAGEYYVIAHYAGYISARDYIFPGALSPEASGRRDPPPEFVQRVRVAPGVSAKVAIRLRRGGSIRGRVTDGAGAAIANVGLTPKLKLGAGAFADILGAGAAHSDAEGNYRIDGLPEGSYVVLGGIEGGMIRVSGGARLGGAGAIAFSGGGMRASKARVATVQGAGDVSGVDLVFPRNGPRVQGSVVAADGQRLREGLVRLYPTGEPRFSLATPVDADGSFEFTRIPADTYTLMLDTGARNDRAATVEIRVAGSDVTGVKVPATPIR